MCVVCPKDVGLALGGVAIVVAGLVDCLTLLVTKSLSIASHFEPSSAVVSHVVSFVTSLLPACTLVGCR